MRRHISFSLIAAIQQLQLRLLETLEAVKVSTCQAVSALHQIERGSSETDEMWDAHIEQLTELSKLLGDPGGALRKLKLSLGIYMTKKRPVFCLFMPHDKWRVRTLLRTFPEHVVDKYINASAMVADEHT